MIEDDDDDDYPRPRVKKEELYPGCPVVYMPDVDNPNFDPSFYTDELPVGSIGIFIEMGSNWEKFVKGHEPIRVLFGTAGVLRVYMDEIELVP